MGKDFFSIQLVMKEAEECRSMRKESWMVLAFKISVTKLE